MGGEVFERAGGIAVSLPGGEIFTSLQTGVIDATEWVGPYNDMAFGLHQVARYYYYPGWQEPGPALELIINKAEYDALPEDLQEILEVAGRAMNADVLSEYTARNNASLSELVDKHGIEIRRLPDDVIAEFKRIAKEVVTEVVDDDDPLTRQIYDSYSQFLENVSNYHEISERAYINTRGSDTRQ